MKFLIQLISDKDDRISHARFLNLVIGFCACLYCWKLVWTGEFTETYFMWLLLYGAGQQTINKFLDLRGGNEAKSKTSEPDPAE